jgi:hypothetical protein
MPVGPRSARPSRPDPVAATSSASSSGLMLPLPPPPLSSEPGSLPPTPIDTLRGTGMSRRDSARTSVDPMAVESMRRGYDPSRVAQRDAVVRRLVWTFVLVFAAVIGIVLANRL